MRIGIIAFLHESNTFSVKPTTVEDFRQNLLLEGEAVRHALADAHHEVGGFFEGLETQGAEAIPLFAARALPSGTITAGAFATLTNDLLDALSNALPLDGLLVAPHGATVSEDYPDADGYWLSSVRAAVGPDMPIVGTLDAHANLSRHMVQCCNALVAYRTNPHLDQRERGIEAARLVVRMVRGEIRPTMSAVFPPLAISIDRQCTDEPHLQRLYESADGQLQQPGVLSNSILLGFPYADVEEMGSSVLVVTDNDQTLATTLAKNLAGRMWDIRGDLAGTFISVDEALAECANAADRICLLDMGDNVGGGSAADGTQLVRGIVNAELGPAFACLYDPQAVETCESAGQGRSVFLDIGGKSDQLHGLPLALTLKVRSFHDGQFHESRPRHGGITSFDQGRTAICEAPNGLTLMLTSRRMVPFSLEQLRSCHLDPSAFRLLVAKGVNAPIAAYREVCDRFIRVNTMGSTCADMRKLPFRRRRSPLFPFDRDLTWSCDEIENGHLAMGRTGTRSGFGGSADE